MPLPDFIRAFPAADIPFPAEVVSTNALRSDAGLAVFFTFHRDMDLPGAQNGRLHGQDGGACRKQHVEDGLHGGKGLCALFAIQNRNSESLA